MSPTVSSAKNVTCSIWEKQSMNSKRATVHRISDQCSGKQKETYASYKKQSG
jgi:hypothetical protein